jgi:hypothetical protein
MSPASAAEDDAYYSYLQERLEAAQDDEQLFDAIVNAPFHDRLFTTHLDLGIIVFLLVNKKTKTIDRIALSNTEQAKAAVRMTAKPFKQIKIPVGHPTNILARAIETQKHYQTHDWQYLFVPELTVKEARFNQHGAGIECSVVYPLIGARGGGAMIFSFFQVPNNIGAEHHAFMKTYSTMVAKALQK